MISTPSYWDELLPVLLRFKRFLPIADVEISNTASAHRRVTLGPNGRSPVS